MRIRVHRDSGARTHIPLLEITHEQGEQIALAIVSVWAVAWGIRQVIFTIRKSGADKEETES